MKPIAIVEKHPGWIGVTLEVVRHEVRDEVLWIMAGGEHRGEPAGGMLAFPLHWSVDKPVIVAGHGPHSNHIVIVNPQSRFDSFVHLLADAYHLPRPAHMAERTVLYAEAFNSQPERVLEERVTIKVYFLAGGHEGLVHVAIDLAAGIVEWNDSEPESGRAVLAALVEGTPES